MSELTSLSSHFKFGENWANFSRLISPARIASAERCLRELVGPSLDDQAVIDVGCGSGLHSLAAARLGAKHITATDIDPECTQTTQALLGRDLPNGRFAVQTASVFDLRGAYDVVYAWGSLHHTGDMWRAIDACSNLTKAGGLFVFAIYKRTPLCAFWTVEKRFYRAARRPLQRAILALFRAAYYTAKLATFQNPWRLAREYHANRGMDQWYDFHDWLGGYPYESATPESIDRFMVERGFQRELAKNLKPMSGLFGSGCAEYVYRRKLQ